MATDVRNALIVGAGLAGLASAISLSRAGVAVDVVEIEPELRVVGVGILLQGNMIRACETLGIADECVARGFGSEGRRQFDAHGDNPVDIPGWSVSGNKYPKQLGITRPDLSAILYKAAVAAGASVRMGVTVADLEQSADSVSVRSTDGTQREYDLVVGADGIFSTVRQILFGDLGRPEYSGQGCFRCNMPRLPEVDRVHNYVGSNARAGLVPLRNDLMYLLCVVNVDEAVRMPRGDLARILREYLRPFGGLIAYCRDHFIDDPESVVYRPFHVVRLPDPWFKGRVIVIGDAAHATTGHLGQAGAMAVEDAVVLGEEVGKSVVLDEALRAFMRRRFQRCQFIVESSMQIAKWERSEHARDEDSRAIVQQMLEVVRQPI